MSEAEEDERCHKARATAALEKFHDKQRARVEEAEAAKVSRGEKKTSNKQKKNALAEQRRNKTRVFGCRRGSPEFGKASSLAEWGRG